MPREEHDLIGTLSLPDHVLWGVHTARALQNFPSTGRSLPVSLVKAFALVKKAAAVTNGQLGRLHDPALSALLSACDEIAAGSLGEHLVVDPLCGGAGTSLNMNVNEVLANRANQLLGAQPGAYAPVHPLDTVNLHQSTNDVFATAVRVAVLADLEALEQDLVVLQGLLQEKEQAFADVVMVGRTQLQDALPMTAGQLFSTFAEAVARDRWRVFKSVERVKVVNLGGTAIGTGVGAPRQYIFMVIEELRRLTGLPLARAENPVEATANQDALAEVDGNLMALAVNLHKVALDLRTLSMGPVGEMKLPPLQAGSSLMPGKVNPVVPEYVQQLCKEVMGGHGVLMAALAEGNLQLSQFLPLAAWHILDHLRLLRNATQVLAARCVAGVEVDGDACRRHLEGSLSSAAALVPTLGYEKMQQVVVRARAGGITLAQAMEAEGIDAATVANALKPSRLRRLGD